MDCILGAFSFDAAAAADLLRIWQIREAICLVESRGAYGAIGIGVFMSVDGRKIEADQRNAVGDVDLKLTNLISNEAASLVHTDRHIDLQDHG